ncbi:hypothetical protein IJU97_04900 [bacterium]|nr:hypothetical protein [bacterium]
MLSFNKKSDSSSLDSIVNFGKSIKVLIPVKDGTTLVKVMAKHGNNPY